MNLKIVYLVLKSVWLYCTVRIFFLWLITSMNEAHQRHIILKICMEITSRIVQWWLFSPIHEEYKCTPGIHESQFGVNEFRLRKYQTKIPALHSVQSPWSYLQSSPSTHLNKPSHHHPQVLLRTTQTQVICIQKARQSPLFPIFLPIPIFTSVITPSLYIMNCQWDIKHPCLNPLSILNRSLSPPFYLTQAEPST